MNFENQFYLPDKRGLYFMIETVLLDNDGAHLLSESVPYGIEPAGNGVAPMRGAALASTDSMSAES